MPSGGERVSSASSARTADPASSVIVSANDTRSAWSATGANLGQPDSAIGCPARPLVEEGDDLDAYGLQPRAQVPGHLHGFGAVAMDADRLGAQRDRVGADHGHLPGFEEGDQTIGRRLRVVQDGARLAARDELAARKIGAVGKDLGE